MRHAKAICNGGKITVVVGGADLEIEYTPCPVLNECREYALETRFQHGIIGGMSERERKVEIKKRRKGERP